MPESTAAKLIVAASTTKLLSRAAYVAGFLIGTVVTRKLLNRKKA